MIPSPPPEAPPARRRSLLSWPLLLLLCGAHAWAILAGMGGREGLLNSHPLARHDHALYLHSAIVTRSFLAQSWTTAGYDPSFMAGYPKSIIFPASSTLPEVALALAPGTDPIRTYKAYVFIAAAIAPALLALAVGLLGGNARAMLIAVALGLIYIWTDFPINYAEFGMLPYFVAVPLGLVASACALRWLERGGAGGWIASALALSLMALAHFTTLMVAGPALATAYIFAARKQGWSRWRHLATWGLIPAILALNAFWWLPGPFLAGTKGVSDFAFAHSGESVLGRLAQIATQSPGIELALWIAGLVGLVAIARRGGARAVGLATWILAGLGWGYLAGWSSALDFLQPGRHTYALYLGLAVAAGLGIGAILERLRPRWEVAALLGLAIAAAWASYPALEGSLRYRLDSRRPFLAPTRSRDLDWLVDQLKRQMRPGERLLYEEAGKDLPGLPDPFAGARYSGLIPHLVPDIELIGGPYLHAALTTNFSQFGEGKLCEKPDWGRPEFEKYAHLYGIGAIACWSPKAKQFCRDHPDLIEIVAEDRLFLLGRVREPEAGPAIRGSATVEAAPGLLKVRAESAGVDGLTVLRYHWSPGLRSDPGAELLAVPLEDDPVPFIGLRPSPRPVTIRLVPGPG